MMATVLAKMYGEEESPFAHVGRDAAAMVNRVNELRKWASVIPDLTKLAKLKCPGNITNAVRNLPADVAGILSTGASMHMAWTDFSAALAALGAGERGALTADEADFLAGAGEFMATYVLAGGSLSTDEAVEEEDDAAAAAVRRRRGGACWAPWWDGRAPRSGGRHAWRWPAA